jgi:four helix bundle protein
MRRARRFRMVAKHLEELVAWQLTRDLERKIFAFTAIDPAVADDDYCRQIRRSSASASRNIAEGFGRFWPAEFARLVRIARGELYETRDHLNKALEESYVPANDHEEMVRLANRALGACTRLVVYLESAAEKWKKDYRKRVSNRPAGRKNPTRKG